MATIEYLEAFREQARKLLPKWMLDTIHLAAKPSSGGKATANRRSTEKSNDILTELAKDLSGDTDVDGLLALLGQLIDPDGDGEPDALDPDDDDLELPDDDGDHTPRLSETEAADLVLRALWRDYMASHYPPVEDDPDVMPAHGFDAPIELAEWSAADINDLPDSSFAYIETGGEKDDEGKTTPRELRHYPYKGADGQVDVPHLNNALARASQALNGDNEEAKEIATKALPALHAAQASLKSKAYNPSESRASNGQFGTGSGTSPAGSRTAPQSPANSSAPFTVPPIHPEPPPVPTYTPGPIPPEPKPGTFTPGPIHPEPPPVPTFTHPPIPPEPKPQGLQGPAPTTHQNPPANGSTPRSAQGAKQPKQPHISGGKPPRGSNHASGGRHGRRKWDLLVPTWIDKADALGDDEQHLVYGVVLVPELTDSQGDVVSAEEIEATAHQFLVKYRNQGVQHVGDVLPSIEVVESYIAPIDMEIAGRQVPQGSWVLVSKVNDPEIWEMVKDGRLASYSIQGTAMAEPELEAA